MKPVVTAEQMAKVDARAQSEFGIPSLILMEHAGLALYRLLCRLDGDPRVEGAPRLPDDGTSVDGGNGGSSRRQAKNADSTTVLRTGREKPRLVVFAGRGNNGGDGLVIARLAAIDGRYAVEVVDAGCEQAGSDSQTGIHLASCRALGVPITANPHGPLGRLSSEDWIVDAISGTGIKGALRDEKAELIASINAAARSPTIEPTAPRVFSVDVPSGLGDQFCSDYPVILAHVTATVGWHKRCLLTPAGRRHAGSIYLVDINFPRQLDPFAGVERPVFLLEPRLAPKIISNVSETAHKGERGHLAIFSGSHGTAGAAMLCANAASHARTGLVSLITDTAVAERLEGLNPSIMVNRGDNPQSFLDSFSRRIDAALIGPGWGTHEPRRESLIELTRRIRRGVLDADALTMLASTEKNERRHLADGEWVVTPHPGECARLAACSTEEALTAPERIVGYIAAEYGVTVVLKTATTWIAAIDGAITVFDGAHRAAGVGGSGDVFAGIVAAFLASGAGPVQAARSAVLVHSRAIRLCFSARGWFTSAQLPEYVAKALAAMETSNRVERYE